MIELIFYDDHNFWGKTTKINNSWLYNKQRNNQKEKKTEGPAATWFSANSNKKQAQWPVLKK